MIHSSRPTAMLVHALLLLAVMVSTFPLLWMVIVSLREPAHAFGFSLGPPLTLANYSTTLIRSIKFFSNSFVVASLSTLISLTLGTTAAYGLSRYRFVGAGAVNLAVMVTRMLPPVLLAIGMFRLVAGIGLYDSLVSLVLLNSLFTLPFAIWMMQGFLNSIPVEIDEAGMIDGCTRLGALFRLILPVSAPGLMATLVYAFLIAWNEYLFAVTFIQSNDKKLATVALAEIMGEWWTNYPELMAMAVLISAPIMILFLLVQRYLVAGLASSAVKG